MSLKTSTRSIQSQLASYCKDGVLSPIEGAREERLPTYRRLVFNVIRDTLRQAYPISYEILSKEEWGNLVYDFFKNHNCQHHEVWKMPYELVEYVESTQYHISIDKPYLLELLYFEWLEIEIHGHEDVDLPDYVPYTGELEEVLVLNPYTRLIQLNYPVHKMSHREVSAHQGHYFVLIYRDLSEDKVHFMELSPFTAQLLVQLQESDGVPSPILKGLAEKAGQPEETIIHHANNFLFTLQEKEVVLGIKKK